ncbi:hypothetical protein LOOC260_100600 [Paucilactobacillus hokkaidonensis JCM 18461]|uniref:Protein G-related albumin-binding (GA) module domain-containing protein n=2 Tax=Paucilactobacillus hokkaidonensis TaxID=1193095 RepID=A0A0A1GUH3_9LACO|nr:GA module-containing protein [Paucilactobacillus hokkaidonensis]BAP84639.1 hypothetical protein LOOC260_100600 [Paucilactobacillus hokkaidonensis JCM 18461]
MSIETKVNKFKSSSKKLAYTSMAAVSLLGVGVGATTVALNAQPTTVSAAGLAPTFPTLNIYIGGKMQQIEFAEVVPVPNKVMTFKVPAVAGYTASRSTIQYQWNSDGTSGTILTPFTYTANGSSTNTGSTSTESGSASTGSASTGSSSNTAGSTNSNNTSATGNTSSSNNSSTVSTAKTDAIKAIDNNSSLSATAKANAKAAINKATTKAGVSAVVSAATSNKSSKTGDVQTSVSAGVLPTVGTGLTSLIAGLGLAFRKFIA